VAQSISEQHIKQSPHHTAQANQKKYLSARSAHELRHRNTVTHPESSLHQPNKGETHQDPKPKNMTNTEPRRKRRRERSSPMSRTGCSFRAGNCTPTHRAEATLWFTVYIDIFSLSSPIASILHMRELEKITRSVFAIDIMMAARPDPEYLRTDNPSHPAHNIFLSLPEEPATNHRACLPIHYPSAHSSPTPDLDQRLHIIPLSMLFSSPG